MIRSSEYAHFPCPQKMKAAAEQGRIGFRRKLPDVEQRLTLRILQAYEKREKMTQEELLNAAFRSVRRENVPDAPDQRNLFIISSICNTVERIQAQSKRSVRESSVLSKFDRIRKSIIAKNSNQDTNIDLEKIGAELIKEVLHKQEDVK